MTKFKGVIPALVSPIDENEKINASVLHSLIDYLIAKGADGFYVGGATGEGLNLAHEQRFVLAEESVGHAGGKIPCIIQVA